MTDIHITCHEDWYNKSSPACIHWQRYKFIQFSDLLHDGERYANHIWDKHFAGSAIHIVPHIKVQPRIHWESNEIGHTCKRRKWCGSFLEYKVVMDYRSPTSTQSLPKMILLHISIELYWVWVKIMATIGFYSLLFSRGFLCSNQLSNAAVFEK